MAKDLMKALVYLAPEKLELRDIKIPQIEQDEVLIRVRACGICGSDVFGYLGKTGRRIPPMVMGHEFAGEITCIGNHVMGFAVGDRVTAQPICFCGECDYCISGRESLCTSQTMLGVLHTNGALCEYVKVRQRQLVRIPDTVSFDIAALAEPFAVAYSAVLKADVQGRRVAVIGTGTIGLFTIAALRLAQAGVIYAFDTIEAKRTMALKMGATQAFDPSQKSALPSLLELTGGGVDVSFEAVGAESSVHTAMSCLKKGGTSVWIGNNIREIKIDMQQIVTRELRVLGNFDYSQATFAEAVEKLTQQDLRSMISETAPLVRAHECFQRLAEKRQPSLKTMIYF